MYFVCMYVPVHVRMCVYVAMCVCVCVCVGMYILCMYVHVRVYACQYILFRLSDVAMLSVGSSVLTAGLATFHEGRVPKVSTNFEEILPRAHGK